MQKNLFAIVSTVMATILLSACGPEQPAPLAAPAEARTEPGSCVQYKTDNGLGYSGSNGLGSYGPCLPVDTNLYKVRVEVVGEAASNTQIKGSVSGFAAYGFGSMSGRIWQDGKGVLLVRLVGIDPPFGGFVPGDLIVLKTTDLKVIALPTGSLNDLICNRDTEVMSPNYVGQLLTDDRITYELDWCRMITPKVVATPSQ